jgi:hypothetical protein
MGAIIAAIIGALGNIFLSFRKQKVEHVETVAREAEHSEVKLQEQVAINEDVKKAQAASGDLARELADKPSSLWDDDGYQVGGKGR